MPECSCPFCKTVFRAPSSAFGETVRCPSCHNEYLLRTEYLAHFDLPESIRIQFREPGGQTFTRFSLAVIVEYGYQLPPLRSDESGQVLITKDMFVKAQRDDIDLADRKGDPSLNRFVRIRIPNRDQALEIADARANYGSFLYPYEKELYGNLRALCSAYVPAQDVVPFIILVGLVKRQPAVTLEHIVSVP